MPDDERESDDLFEDLDKFFAPIKDVEWDEPEEPAPPADTGDEHVVVRSGSEAVVTVPPTAGESPETGPTFEDDDEEDSSDWYDTASLDPVDQALGGGDDRDDAGVVGAPGADGSPRRRSGRPLRPAGRGGRVARRCGGGGTAFRRRARGSGGSLLGLCG